VPFGSAVSMLRSHPFTIANTESRDVAPILCFQFSALRDGIMVALVKYQEQAAELNSDSNRVRFMILFAVVLVLVTVLIFFFTFRYILPMF
jgi:hypothetical protein